MKTLFGIIIGILFGGALIASAAVTIFNVQQGGTGVGTFSSGQLIYGNGTAALSSVATSSLSASSPLTGSFTVIGTTGSVGCQTASGSQAGCLSSADWTTFNGKGSGTVTSVATNNGVTGGTINTTGTIGLATINAGVLGAVTNGSVPTSQATSTLYGTGVGGQILTWANGVPQWVASTTYADGTGISHTFIGGQLTTTNTGVISLTNGTGINCSGTNPGSCSLVVPVTYANGGTGTTTSVLGQLRYMGATADQGVATSSASCSSGVSCSAFTVVGTVNPSITNTGVTSIVAGTNITVSGATGAVTVNCPSCGGGGGGGSFPFSSDNTYAQQVYSTSTPTLFFKSGLFASSTSYFGNGGVGSSTVQYGMDSLAWTVGELGTDNTYKISVGTALAPLPAVSIDRTSLVTTLAGGFVSQASSTIIGNATTTGTLFAGIASSTNTFGAGLASCNGTNALSWSGGLFGCVAVPQGTVTSIATTYPVTGGTFTTSGTIALAFGTTTANTWSSLQTFNGGASSTQISAAQGFFNSFAATSTTATSTVAFGLNVATSGGCIAFNGTCLTSSISQIGAFKAAVNYATTAALPANTYLSGVLTEVGTGALSVDGASPAIGNRILVKNEVTQTNNGIYTVTATGSGIAAYVLTRASDFNTNADIYPGVSTYVLSGTANSDDVWTLTTPAPVVLDTSNLTFVESANGNITLPITVANGGTGQQTLSSSQLLYGNGTAAVSSVATGTLSGSGGLSVTAGTSIIGGAATISCASCALFGFPFTPSTFGTSASNATGTLIGFTGGLYATASSTIGNGNQNAGLTINGGATTTGSASILGQLAIGTSSLAVNSQLYLYNTNTSGASPSMVIGGNAGGDTDFWIGRQNQNDSINNDSLQVGLGLIPGTTPLMNWTYQGREGIASTSPFATLSIHANPTDLAVNTTLFAIGSSTASATTTLFSIDNTGAASTTKLFGANLATCNTGSSALTWSAGFFGCNSISATGGSYPFTPTSAYGLTTSATTSVINNLIGLFASSTSYFSQINAGFGSFASTTASSTPWGLLSVQANGLATNVPAFVVGSSTRTSFIITNSGYIGIGTTSPLAPFTLDAQGGTGSAGTASTTILEYEYDYGKNGNFATGTAITINALTRNQFDFPMGTSATTLTICNMYPGQHLIVKVDNPNAAAGALTWSVCAGSQLYWTGLSTMPTQTTTANHWDIWSFDASVGSSTSIVISGAQTPF